jgi:hypothetical protein
MGRKQRWRWTGIWRGRIESCQQCLEVRPDEGPVREALYQDAVVSLVSKTTPLKRSIVQLTVFQVCTFPEEVDHGCSGMGSLGG